LGIPFVLAPRLVRGLDYYRLTTFEFAAEALDAAQNAVGGGGRYDGLVEELGGPPTPGIGFALGVDRTLLACDAEAVFPPPPANVDVWVIDTTDGFSALELTFLFRAAGLSADRSFDGRSMKAQMKAADRSGAAVAVIVGDDEIAAAEVTVRPLRAAGDQRRVARADVIEHVRKLIDA
jgi:histidyl-tRNA synthetase